MVNEIDRRLQQNHWGFRVGTGDGQRSDYTQFYRHERRQPRYRQRGLFPPRIEAFGDPRPSARIQTGRVAVSAGPALQRRRPGRACRCTGRSAAAVRCRGGTRTSASRSRTTCPGRRAVTTSSSGSSSSATARPSRARNDYDGVYNFGHSADNPISTGNGYANALLGVFTRYNERDKRIDRESRHWQCGRVRAGQLARHRG